MKHFEKRYQLWQSASSGGYIPEDFDTLRQALTADRHHDGDDWYITELISDEQIDLVLKKEMEGYPVVYQDLLGKLKQTYQLWNGTMDRAYTLSEHSQLRDALKAQRLFEDWYVTQVIVTPG